MANYTNLKNIIDQYITTNGQGDITGAILNDVLKNIVDSIGADFLFAGVAEPTTNPGSPDQNVFYIAIKGGTYTNFGNVVIPNGITIFQWNGSWSNQILFAGDGGVFDITAYHNGTKYADLTAALGISGANVPQSLRKGGMSVKFVQSYDDKYVQYRLTNQNWSTTVTDWQEMDTVRGENVYNANYGKPAGTFFTLLTAIQDVPLSYRRTGLILIFRDNRFNVNAYHYKAGQIDDQFFEDTGNWVQIPIRPILMSLCDNKLLRAIGIADSVFPQWTSNTLYKVGAVIKHDDNLMRCKTEHTSGESYDASKFGVTTYGEFLRRYGGSVVLNYTTMKGVGPISFSSLDSTFLATIDSLYREAGLILMIRTSNKGILYYQYNTANVTDEYWTDASNWILLYSTAWGINDTFISQITQTINKVKDLTENIQLTLQNTGKAYNTGTVSVGSVYIESLVGNAVIDSGKVSVKKGDTLYIKGKGAGNPRLWCIVDSSNKVVAISESGALSTEYIRLDINQDGTVYYNTRNDEPDYPFGGYIVSADNITAIMDKIAYITDEPKVISFNNEGKAYNTGNVAVGSTFNGTLSTNATFDSVRVTVKKNDVVLVKGQGGATPLLWCITDTTGKVLSKSESSFKAYEYVTIIIGQDGYVYLNARNDSEDCPLGALLTNNYNLPYLSDLVNKKPTGKWLAMGDSITEGYYSWFTDEPNDVGTYLIIPTKTWVYKLSAMIGKSVINAGIGGTGYKKKGSQGDKLNAKELVDTLDFTGVDVVTLAYGINDYKGSETLGTMADDVSTGNTVVANMRYVIEHIIASNPNIKILVIMPLNARGYSSQRLGDETTNYALGYQVNNKTLQDFYDAMVEVCKYYGIEYVDATHTSVINRKSAAKLLPDGVHPSENAHTLLAKEFARVLIR